MDVRSQLDDASTPMVASLEADHAALACFQAQSGASAQFRAVEEASLRLLTAFVHLNQAIFNRHDSVVGQGQGGGAPGDRSSGFRIAEEGR